MKKNIYPIPELIEQYINNNMRSFQKHILGHFYNEYKYDFDKMLAIDEILNEKYELEIEVDKLFFKGEKLAAPEEIQKQYKEWQFNTKMKELLK